MGNCVDQNNDEFHSRRDRIDIQSLKIGLIIPVLYKTKRCYSSYYINEIYKEISTIKVPTLESSAVFETVLRLTRSLIDLSRKVNYD